MTSRTDDLDREWRAYESSAEAREIVLQHAARELLAEAFRPPTREGPWTVRMSAWWRRLRR